MASKRAGLFYVQFHSTLHQMSVHKSRFEIIFGMGSIWLSGYTNAIVVTLAVLLRLIKCHFFNYYYYHEIIGVVAYFPVIVLGLRK